MNNTKLKIQEDAKADWMKIVNKHKKRQKGLPALSTLNTNAGNVEHNINMFNMMQPSGSINVDASSDNISSDSGCCESLQEEFDKENIILEYDSLPINVVTRRGKSTGYYDYGDGAWYPDDDTIETLFVSHDYEVDKIDAIEFLQDLPEVELDLHYDELSDVAYSKAVEDNFENLVYKYDSKLKAHFREQAIEDAQRKFSYDYEYTFDESCEKKEDVDESLDDKFDMSMRTLL